MTEESNERPPKHRLESLFRGGDWLFGKARKVDQHNSLRHRSGLDSTHLSPEDDVLDRYRIAKEVLRLLTDQPSDWSTRLGLLGEWGSGKTVIANWVAELASKNHHCVVWFNPWSATSVEKMWLELSQALHDELRNQGITLSTRQKLFQRIRTLFNKYGVASEIPGLKYYARVLQQLLRLTNEHIIAMRKQLGPRRILIIIDDLDRADTTLIPKLLLTMRELFELPGFSVLLLFDKSKIIKALELPPHHLSGYDFLEKILDYQIEIPAPSLEQKHSLFNNAVRSVLPQMPPDVEREIANVLPDNPRRIKRIALQLQIAKQQIGRHRVDEIDWRSLLYASILRSENHFFFEKYVRDAFFGDRRLCEALYNRSDFDKRGNAAENTPDGRIQRALEETAPDQAKHERMRQIAKAWESKSPYFFNPRIRYTIHLFDRPHTFTLREFGQLFDLWLTKQDISQIIRKLDEAAKDKSIARDKINRDFIECIFDHYQYYIEGASNELLAADHAKLIKQALMILRMVKEFRSNALLSDEDRVYLFEKLLGAIAPWAHFSGNRADSCLRREEEKLLRELAHDAGAEWRRYAALLEPYHRGGPSPNSFKAVKQKILSIFDDDQLVLLLGAFERDGGLRDLLDRRALAGPRDLFIDPNSRAWAPIENAPVPALLRCAASKPWVQQNAYWFLKILKEDDFSGLDIQKEKVEVLLRADGIAALMWNAAVARRIQYRVLSETQEIYKMLCQQLSDEAKRALLFPDWLKKSHRPGER